VNVNFTKNINGIDLVMKMVLSSQVALTANGCIVAYFKDIAKKE